MITIEYYYTNNTLSSERKENKGSTLVRYILLIISGRGGNV